MGDMYEVFLSQKVVGAAEWQVFLEHLAKLHRQGEKFEITINFDNTSVRIFLKTVRDLPHFLVGADQFVLNKVDSNSEIKNSVTTPSLKTIILRENDNILTLAEKLKVQEGELKSVNLVFRRILKSYTFKTYVVIEKTGTLRLMRLHGATLNVLNVDFRKNYLLNKSPKYLNLAKSLQLLATDEVGSVLKINTYPYLNGEHYLNLMNFDFYKHTVVFGASGSGKTKFLSSLIEKATKLYGDKYHFLVIDPHDAIRQDLGGLELAKVYDFTRKERSLNLFLKSEQDIINNVDMAQSLFRALIQENWNSRLERLLRASLYLLIEKNDLSFQNLRRLLTDVTYKNTCLKEVQDYLPESLQEFFGQDYNELRTQYYDVTFAQILSLIDELQLTPAFYRGSEKRLDFELRENKLTIVSLNQASLGEKAVKTLAGLMMNQLFALGIQRKLDEHVVLVIDEVAVVENPVLTRFLAEARKYNISVILAGQYFSQISTELKTAIYANTANYFCFRLNYEDAEQLVNYLDIDLASNSQTDYAEAKRATFVSASSPNYKFERVKLLTQLADRQVVSRVSKNGILATAILGRSLDFVSEPEFVKDTQICDETRKVVVDKNLERRKFRKTTSQNIMDLMREQSTSRRKVN